MSINYRIISIGTLAAHPLWEERTPVRGGHATTTLITTDNANILVDPSLPPQALVARLDERSNIKPDQITHVFLTSVDQLHSRGLPAFENANWLAHEPDLDAALTQLDEQIRQTEQGDDTQLLSALENQRKTITNCVPASDSIVKGVDLFPLPGVTEGACGLLLPLPRSTVLICGDAIATTEHLEKGRVLPNCHNVEQAQASFTEAIEIADVFILGRDNIIVNPLRKPFGM